MQRKRDGLVFAGEAFAGLDGPVKTLRFAELTGTTNSAEILN